jgi:hypothetical protein
MKCPLGVTTPTGARDASMRHTGVTPFGVLS